MAAYTEFRGHGFADWHPTKAEMLVGHRAAGASTAQLFRLDAAMGELKPVTQGPEPAGGGSYEPKAGRYIVFARSSGGNEVTQLYRQGFDGAAALQITHSDERNGFAGWRKPQGEIVYTSVPIDRTAQGGTRRKIMTSFWAVDPEAKDPIQARRKLVELEGGGWGGSVSEDGMRMALSVHQRQRIPALGDGASKVPSRPASRCNCCPSPAAPRPRRSTSAASCPTAASLLVATDRFGEFRELTVLDAKTQELQRITAHISLGHQRWRRQRRWPHPGAAGQCRWPRRDALGGHPQLEGAAAAQGGGRLGRQHAFSPQPAAAGLLGQQPQGPQPALCVGRQGRQPAVVEGGRARRHRHPGLPPTPRSCAGRASTAAASRPDDAAAGALQGQAAGADRASTAAPRPGHGRLPGPLASTSSRNWAWR
jgi:hypothetical protein